MPVIVDVGTGSGCIAVALAKEIPNARIFATDQSRGALVVAARNARKHGVCSQIEFRLGDLLAPFPLDEFQDGFDFVVSNPPYIPHRDHQELPPEVRIFEPTAALHSRDDNPTEIHRRLIQQSELRLRAGGYVVAEIGAGQKPAVESLFDTRKWLNLHFVNDLQSIPRVVAAKKR